MIKMNTTNFDKKKATFMTDTGFIKQKSTNTVEYDRKTTLNYLITKQPTDIKEEENENFKNEFREKKTNSGNLYEKILFLPSDPNYYGKFASIKLTPGANFIRELFKHDKTEKIISTLRINIPDTFFDESYYVYNDPNNHNVLTLETKGSRNTNFIKKIETMEKILYNRDTKETDPFLIVRQNESEYENSVVVESYGTAQQIIGKDLSGTLVQRYIKSKGRNRDLMHHNTNNNEFQSIKLLQHKNNFNLDEKTEDSDKTKNNRHMVKNESNSDLGGIHKESSNVQLVANKNNQYNKETKPAVSSSRLTHEKKIYTKPSVVRLEFKTRYNSSKKPNIAYYLINREYIEPYVLKNKTLTQEKFTNICTIQTKKKSTYDIVVMSGDAIKQYEFYANEIVCFVKKIFKLTLKTIVIDFIKDERGIIYFLGVKSFTPYKEFDDPTPSFNVQEYLKEDKNLKKIYKTLTCKLCHLSYPKSNINKVVTFKLLLDLKENLIKRGEDIFKHIFRTKTNESMSCQVCNLCYKLIITEQELLEIQKTIAMCNNIPIQTEEDLIKESTNEFDLNQIKTRLDKANQWRVMFYFVKFYALDFSKLTFNNKFNYKLYIKIFDVKYGMPIFTDINKFKSEDEVEINLSKVFYFFTKDNSNLKQILKNEEIDFRIVLNDDWHSPIAQCVTTCLAFFENETSSKTARVKNTLNFFSNQMKYFKCQVYVGLNYDGMIETNNLFFYDYKFSETIYLTDQNYFSHHPLPSDWYELFAQNYVPIEDLQEKEQQFEQMIKNIIYQDEFPKTLPKIVQKQSNLPLWKRETSARVKKLEDMLVDPYNVLVDMQGKKSLISKMQSIPVIYDKKYLDKEKQNCRTRPQTSVLATKFKVPIVNESNKMNEDSQDKNMSNESHCSSSQSDNSDWIKKGKQIKLSEEKMSDEMLNNILGQIDRHINDNFKEN